MPDIRLIQGLLIATCVSLICAIGITIMDIGRHQMPPGMGVASAAGTAPAPTVTPTPAAAPVKGPVAMAPQGTLAIIIVDVPKLAADPDLKDPVAGMVPPGVDVAWLAEATIFATPPPTPAAEPGAAAVLTLAPGSGPKVDAWLKAKGTPLTVSGASAYKVTLEEAGPPAPAGAAAQAQSGVFSLADESTLLAAETEQDLAAMLKAKQSGGSVDPQLAQLLGQFSSGTIRAAILATPDTMKAAGSSAASLTGLKACALKVDLGAAYDVQALLRFGAADQAQKVVADAKAKITEFKDKAKADPQSAAMAKPLIDILDKVTMGNQAADATFAVKLTKQDAEQAMQVVVMMMMAEAMKGAGGTMTMQPMAPPTPPVAPAR